MATRKTLAIKVKLRAQEWLEIPVARSTALDLNYAESIASKVRDLN